MDAVTAIELSSLSDLGPAAVTPDRLNLLVSCVVGEPVQVTTLAVAPVSYPNASIATGALLRCTGTAIGLDGECRHWRVFVKLLQSARVWPLLNLVPAHLRQLFVDGFPWRVEIDAYLSRLPELFADGMRLPVIYDVIEIDDDRAAIWMEDVLQAPEPWGLDRFERAAHDLGVLAGCRPLGSDVVFGPADTYAAPGRALRMFVDGRVRFGIAPLLHDDELWQQPALREALAETGESGIRTELSAALTRLDGWLAAMDALPQTYCHGDASPQNLLSPADDPSTCVIIDFGFSSPQCVGFDLGQLLVGLVHAGELDAGGLDTIRRVIVPAYTDGLRSTGFEVAPGDVERGFLTSMVVRSLFTALPLETAHLAVAPDVGRLWIQRLRLTRYLLECAAEITAPVSAV